MRLIGLAVVLALSFLAPLTVKAQPAPNAPPADRADATLAFFDTAEKVSPSDLERYERITLFQGMTLYVARAPAIAFRTSEIMSVLVARLLSGQADRLQQWIFHQAESTTLSVLRYNSGHRKGRLKILSIYTYGRADRQEGGMR
jgi:hypothetical protein